MIARCFAGHQDRDGSAPGRLHRRARLRVCPALANQGRYNIPGLNSGLKLAAATSLWGGFDLVKDLASVRAIIALIPLRRALLASWRRAKVSLKGGERVARLADLCDEIVNKRIRQVFADISLTWHKCEVVGCQKSRRSALGGSDTNTSL